MDIEDYSVTKEMVVEYIQSLEGKRRGFSVVPYPSEADALLYVVNFEEGWKIVPGDSRFGLVLAQSLKGNVDLSDTPENPGFRFWLEETKDALHEARGREYKSADTDESVRIWKMIRGKQITEQRGGKTKNKNESKSGTLWAKINFHGAITIDTLAYKAPLIQTKWGQGYPWNVSMPVMGADTCITGCPAVAVSQILYYFHSQLNMPTGLYDSVSIMSLTSGDDEYHCFVDSLNRSNFMYNSPKWGNMPLDSTAINPSGYKNVSDLMLDVGVRLKQQYGPWITYVLTNVFFPTYDVTPCNISGTWAQYSVSSTYPAVRGSLNSNKPVIVSGNGNGGGHTWIIDGYLDMVETYTRYYEWWPVSMIPDGTVIYGYMEYADLLSQYGTAYPGMPAIEPEPYHLELLSMNWGWDGRYDGEYKSISPNDYTWHGHGSNVAVLYNITPGEFIYN